MLNKRRGSILILALWTLGMLAFLAAAIGLNIRQRITFLAHLEQKNKIRFVTESAVKKAIILLKNDIEHNRGVFNAAAKSFRGNSEYLFNDISLPDGKSEISYTYSDGLENEPVKMFGMVDEESKINLNVVPLPVLKKLILNVFDWDDSRAHDLAQAILAWRESPSSDVHVSSKGPFESMDELLLIKEIDVETFTKLSQYVTVYGSGKVNINTASRPVLIAMDLDPRFVDKILSIRRGNDGQEATADDFIFKQTFDIVSDLKNFFEVDSDQAASIDRLNWANLLDVSSHIYTITSHGVLKKSTIAATIVCVYNTSDGRVEYWSEK